MVKQVRAAHILVKGEDNAKSIMDLVVSGGNFSEVAKEHSLCPSAKKGGDLGWFPRGVMVKEFEKAAFEADKGELVGPVKTHFGYHIIKVLDKK